MFTVSIIYVIIHAQRAVSVVYLGIELAVSKGSKTFSGGFNETQPTNMLHWSNCHCGLALANDFCYHVCPTQRCHHCQRCTQSVHCWCNSWKSGGVIWTLMIVLGRELSNIHIAYNIRYHDPTVYVFPRTCTFVMFMTWLASRAYFMLQVSTLRKRELCWIQDFASIYLE